MGYQTEFRRNAGESFGKSNGNYASQVIAGNTFDFPYIHGLSFAEAGKGFVSASLGAVIEGKVDLSDYKIIDLILGKQKTTVTGNGFSGVRFNTFPEKLQKELTKFLKNDGKLIVSGSYVSSDLFDFRSPNGSKLFANEVLGISSTDGPRPTLGKISFSLPGSKSSSRQISYSNTLNENSYIVEYPDVLAPSENKRGEIFMRFSDTNLPAGILTSSGNSKSAIMSVPLESMDKAGRDFIVKEILSNFEK